MCVLSNRSWFHQILTLRDIIWRGVAPPAKMLVREVLILRCDDTTPYVNCGITTIIVVLFNVY